MQAHLCVNEVQGGTGAHPSMSCRQMFRNSRSPSRQEPAVAPSLELSQLALEPSLEPSLEPPLPSESSRL